MGIQSVSGFLWQMLKNRASSGTPGVCFLCLGGKGGEKEKEASDRAEGLASWVSTGSRQGRLDTKRKTLSVSGPAAACAPCAVTPRREELAADGLRRKNIRKQAMIHVGLLLGDFANRFGFLLWVPFKPAKTRGGLKAQDPPPNVSAERALWDPTAIWKQQASQVETQNHRCPFWLACLQNRGPWFRWFIPCTRAIYFSKRPPMPNTQSEVVRPNPPGSTGAPSDEGRPPSPGFGGAWCLPFLGVLVNHTGMGQNKTARVPFPRATHFGVAAVLTHGLWRQGPWNPWHRFHGGQVPRLWELTKMAQGNKAMRLQHLQVGMACRALRRPW